jgi:hypothetical protein
LPPFVRNFHIYHPLSLSLSLSLTPMMIALAVNFHLHISPQTELAAKTAKIDCKFVFGNVARSDRTRNTRQNDDSHISTEMKMDYFVETDELISIRRPTKVAFSHANLTESL